jgi:hypothetical protein
MRRAIDSFRGEAPRVTPRALPDSAAQAAVNARLLTGDLTAFKQFLAVHGLANPGPARTISRLNGAWMSWESDVDVARGTTPGDTTFRTYLTGPDQYAEPRFTTYALATTGAEPYPVTTRPLGVPAPETPPTTTVGVDPTATTFSVNMLDEGDSLATDWVASPLIVGHRSAVQDAGVGNPLPSYKLVGQDNAGSPAYAYRNFGIASAVVISASMDFMFDAGPYAQMIFLVGATADGAGLGVSEASSWSSIGVSALAINNVGALASGTWYTVTVNIVANTDGTRSVTGALYQGSTQLASVSATSTAAIGGYCGFVYETTYTGAGVYYDNILVQASGSTGYVPTNLATSYVYTYVNDLAQESAPSLPSGTILRPDGVVVTVDTPTTLSSGASGYSITAKRIYRAVTGSGGTAYQFVAEIPLATTSYLDTLTDAELGEVLASDLWALPPDDLRGILALPNGIMAGFSKNQLCLSAQNHPHAWPVEYRLNTDTDIVAIGNVDTTVVIGTKSFVYIAGGNDPANFSMGKSDVPYACVSKRSLAYLSGIGVAFAGPDGLMVVAGVGQVRNITETAFTRRQWQALVPSSITAAAHNDIYFMFYDTGSVKGGYAIDMKPTGFGIMQLGFHASAVYADPQEGKLYLALDQDDEPDDTSMPVRPSLPAYINGTTIFAFDSAADLLAYRWRSKLWFLESPTTFGYCRVLAADYTNLLVRFYGDGVQFYEVAVTSQFVFVLPRVASYRQFEIEILGTSTVQSIEVSEDVAELQH